MQICVHLDSLVGLGFQLHSVCLEVNLVPEKTLICFFFFLFVCLLGGNSYFPFDFSLSIDHSDYSTGLKIYQHKLITQCPTWPSFQIIHETETLRKIVGAIFLFKILTLKTMDSPDCHKVIQFDSTLYLVVLCNSVSAQPLLRRTHME